MPSLNEDSPALIDPLARTCVQMRVLANSGLEFVEYALRRRVCYCTMTTTQGKSEVIRNEGYKRWRLAKEEFNSHSDTDSSPDGN